MGILCIGMPEIIGGRCDDQIDTLVRYTGKASQCITADDTVYKRMISGGSLDKKVLIGIL